jgi:hypothetical protein
MVKVVMPSSMSRLTLLLVAVLALAPQVSWADVRTQTRTVKAPAAPTAVSVIVEYQRVGRDLLQLQDQRGANECGDLMPRFKAIKLEQAVATTASRIATAATLSEIAAKIERLRGVTVQRPCLDNPLAEGCS